MSGTSSVGQIGQPFNFSSILNTILIPKVVACDGTLPPGARLMWGVIRQRAWRDGICRSTDAQLASDLGVTDRQVRRYCRALETAGLLKTTPRVGTVPTRVLLLAERFSGDLSAAQKRPEKGGERKAKTLPPENGGGRTLMSGPPDINVRGGGHKRPAILARGGSFNGSLVVTESVLGSKVGRQGARSAAKGRPTLGEMEEARGLAAAQGITFLEAMEKVRRPDRDGELTAAADILHVKPSTDQ